MSDNIWDDLQDMVLGRDDPELFVPYEAYASVVDSNRLSLIGRPLNPTDQSLRGVIQAKMEIGECSKRKKDKQVDDDALRNVRQWRKDQGIRFYHVSD